MKRAFGAKTFEQEVEAIHRACSEASDQETVERVSQALPKASRQARNDGEVALACVRLQGELLQHFSEALRADRALVLAAVSKDGRALKYASEELRRDEEVVLAAVRSYGSALGYACEELQHDKEMVLAAVRQDGGALEYASEELQEDKEVVLAAVSNHWGALEHVGMELRGDKDVMLAAVANDGYALEYASAELLADKEVVLTAVSNEGAALEFVSGELLADREVVLAAASRLPSALARASPELRSDKAFVLLVARQSGLRDCRGFYKQAGRCLEKELRESSFCCAADSALALPGQLQPAPTVLVTLTKSSVEHMDGCGSFHAEAMLGLSGEKFFCNVPIKRREHAESGPDLGELAEVLVLKLQDLGKMDENQFHIFLNILNGDGDVLLAATPWDSFRSLNELTVR